MLGRGYTVFTCLYVCPTICLLLFGFCFLSCQIICQRAVITFLGGGGVCGGGGGGGGGPVSDKHCLLALLVITAIIRRNMTLKLIMMVMDMQGILHICFKCD